MKTFRLLITAPITLPLAILGFVFAGSVIGGYLTITACAIAGIEINVE